MKTIVICHIPNDFDYYKSLMEDYSKKLNSIKALKLPPHLTIVSRFKSERYDDFIEALKKEVSNHKSFNLITDSINFFEIPSILKINFKQSQELKALRIN